MKTSTEVNKLDQNMNQITDLTGKSPIKSVLEVVLKVMGEYNSLLHNQSPPEWTNEKLKLSNRLPSGFVCVDVIYNRPN